jgi:hypothetical protein
MSRSSHRRSRIDSQRSSGVDNADNLKGHFLLVVGERDMYVDPASTMQSGECLGSRPARISTFWWYPTRVTVYFDRPAM